MALMNADGSETGEIAYPKAPRNPITEQIHGVEVSDPYRWLESTSSEETKMWSAQQEALWLAQLSELSGRDEWAVRVLDLLGAGYVSAPAWRGERSFFMRRAAGQEHGILLTSSPESGEKVLIDPMAFDSRQTRPSSRRPLISR